jgi:signal transduction histidine kinase
MGAVAMVKSGNANMDTLLPALEKAAAQAQRAGKIISRIRDFVKRSEPRRQAIQIQTVVDNAISLAEIHSRKRQVAISHMVPENLPDVFADPILIEQVLLNLLKNGLESMEHSAVETLVVAVTLHDNQIEVAVTDRGHGLSDPERLFEPFFSTKSEGLGMGLNICRTIIESHHGRLWAVSNPEGGTTFRFTLPCVSSLEAQKHLQSEELLT